MTINSDESMRSFGERIGKALAGGECIQLIGDVGAGKTTLTKGIASGMGITEIVQSPTFTINRTYDTPKGIRLSHYDFYRLNDAGIMADELAESLDDARTVIVIEWGDVVADVMPEDRMTITFASPSESTRDIVIDAVGPKSLRLQGMLA